MHLGQGAAGGVEGGGECRGAGPDRGVEASQVGEQVPGQGFALLVDGGERTDQAKQRGEPPPVGAGG